MSPVVVAYDNRVPQLSVVLATDSLETIRGVIERLRRQTVRDQLELVLVAPVAALLELDTPLLQGFAALRLVEAPSVVPLGPARAAGVHAATAPVVCIGETHSYPHPRWAEVLVRAHAGEWAAVVPGFGNANPGALSWAAFLRDYGRWAEGLPRSETTVVPPYNVAVKRQVLLAFDDRLAEAVGQGDELTQGLRLRRQRACFEPAARIDHANVSRFRPWVAQRFLVGWAIAGERVKRWSWARRLLYIGGSPLIPAVILWRLRGPLRLAFQRQPLPAGTLLAFLVGTVLSAAGEMLGYALGAAGIVARSDEYELHKLRYTVGAVPAR